MNFDIFWSLVSNTAGGPAPVARERYYDESRRFFEGRLNTVDIAWAPSVLSANERGEGQWSGHGYVWLRLSRHQNDEVTASVRLETTKGSLPDPERLAVFAQG